MPEIRITARGLVPSLALLLGIVLLPQLLAGSLSEQEAQSLVAGVHARRAGQALLARANDLGRASATDTEFRRLAAEIEKAGEPRFASLRVRRGLMVPPFSRRTSFLIEARLAGATEAEYFKVRGGSIYNVSKLWWHVRL